jgi:hypothetical protein
VNALAAKIATLDRVLALYGAEAAEARGELRVVIEGRSMFVALATGCWSASRVWPRYQPPERSSNGRIFMNASTAWIWPS